jgi:ATP-dependent exoDNAse (exonuclease V) beta subunit
MTNLSLVPAGAGAGKTWHIQKELGAWVESGDVAPGRILAVTFTEAAASELRERVRGELMARGRIHDALEIDRAYMGTIHALGQRVLTEHAFAAGRSPDSRLLSEPERDLLIWMEMDQCEALTPLMTDLARFGYAWNPLSGASAEDGFRADVFKTVDLIRGLGARSTSREILKAALEALTTGYGPCDADGAAMTEALRLAVAALLEEFPSNIASLFQGNKSAVKDFSTNHRDLRRAARPGVLEREWALWQKLRGLRLSKRGAATPDGYDPLAEAVIAAADALPGHPGPLTDARAQLNALVTGAQEVLEAYQTAKRRSGLIDYADMIVEAEALLRSSPEILEAMLGEIDCVVIDEFQDTNPVQFALLWRLAHHTKRALIVGDTKQSIMGFQGADARLSAALQAEHPEAVTPLYRNWRSDPRIMAVVNTLGPVLFPEGYDPLTPQRAETDVTALEVINLPGGRSDTTPDCIANRVADILAEDTEIYDKALDALRPAKPTDIAVLCYTHGKSSAVAAALEARGLPVRIQQDGWLTAPAMRAARAAMAFAADPDDRHAALTWLTLGPLRMGLEDALRNAADGVIDTHAALDPLRALNTGLASRPVAETIAAVMRVTGLRDWAAGLAAPEQAVADLARLEAEAQEFDSMAPDLRAAAGFHGCGVQVFLGWIVAQTEKAWDRHPDPDGWSGSGIEICTWHAAKGREWPIAVIAGLDQKIAERPGTLGAEFAGFDDLEKVLDHAGLRYLPDFAAPETQAVFADAQRQEDEREAARELYVALTRARDRLILALPKEKTSARDCAERMVDLLRDRARLQAEGATLSLCGTDFAARICVGVPDLPETPTQPADQGYARFGAPSVVVDGPRTAWRRSPSTLQDSVPVPPFDLQTMTYGPGVKDSRKGSAAERGTAWHLALRVLAQRPDLAAQLPATTGLTETTLQEIAAQATALTDWLAARGYAQLHFELPMQTVFSDGSETNAIIDCLAEGPHGLLIVDHKSGPCPDPEARFATYCPQLMAYADLVGARWPDKPLQGIAINWMSEGTLSLSHATIKEPA